MLKLEKRKTMNWSHLLIEGYCVFNPEKDKALPSCCTNGAGKISFNCLLHDEEGKRMCPYFGFQKSKSTLALTNNEGNTIAFDSFESNQSDENKWQQEELRWVNEKAKVIKNK